MEFRKEHRPIYLDLLRFLRLSVLLILSVLPLFAFQPSNSVLRQNRCSLSTSVAVPVYFWPNFAISPEQDAVQSLFLSSDLTFVDFFCRNVPWKE